MSDHPGLFLALHVAITESFHLATQLAGLDHASHGRAGWLVGTAGTAAELATVGEPPLSSGELRRELDDVIRVARDLWDSWQDDAVIRELDTGRYLDPARVHHVDFTGTRFTVKGPLITPRPPQGQVVVIAHTEYHDALAYAQDLRERRLPHRLQGHHPARASRPAAASGPRPSGPVPLSRPGPAEPATHRPGGRRR